MLKRTMTLGLLALLAFPFGASAQTPKELDEITREMEDRIDEIETLSLLDNIQVSGEFRAKMDIYSVDNNITSSGADESVDTEDIWSNRFRLKFDSDINEDLVFKSRLSYFNLHNESNMPARSTFMTDQKRAPSEGSEIRVERAYFDWFIPDTNFSLTLGRLPMGEGPPLEFKDNRKRLGTYPLSIIDGAFDGAVLSYNFEEATGIERAVAHLVYSKYFADFGEIESADGLDDTTAYAIGWDSAIPGIPNSFLWASVLYLEDFGIGDYEIPGAISPRSLSDMTLVTLHMQAKDIGDTGLDLFYSFNWQNWDNHDDYIVFPAGTVAPVDVAFSFTGSNLAGNLEEDQTATLHFAGLRYELPIKSLNDPKIGFEFSDQSKYGNMSFGGEDYFNKLETLGQTYEFYYVQPLYRHMMARMGYIIHEEEYEDVAFGEPGKSDRSIHNFYLLFDLRF